MTTQKMIDPRGPRFGAAITTGLSLIAFYLSLSNQQLAYSTVVALGVLFFWSVLSPETHPAGLVFKRFIKPRLAPPTELEDSRPPIRPASWVDLCLDRYRWRLICAGVGHHLRGVYLLGSILECLFWPLPWLPALSSSETSWRPSLERSPCALSCGLASYPPRPHRPHPIKTNA